MEDPTTRLKNLVKKANDFDVDDKIPATRYLRSSREMERMALVYASEKQNENGFLLYMKLIMLLVEKLPKHPTYKSLTPEQKKAVKKRCADALLSAEKLKKCVKEQFEVEYKTWLKGEENRKRDKEELEKKHRLATLNINTPSNIGSTATGTTLSSKHSDTTDHLGSYPTVPNVVPKDVPIGTQLWGPSALPSTMGAPTTTPPSTTRPHTAPSSITRPSPSSSPNVPTNLNYHIQPTAPPPGNLPPSYDQAMTHDNRGIAPTHQSVTPQFDRTSKPFGTVTHDYNQSIQTPSINRVGKPQDIISRQVSDSLDGNRRIVIPADLVPRFLQIVSNNTQRNLETCGILNGTLSQNTFRITHLVIPKQSATADSCTTECEEELFDVQDKYDTITLGWIHTHPSQTAFLSSVDLHTQCSYQQLMPEAIAIVCAPKYHTTGIYRLTPQHGLKFITSCRQSGFHPHPKDPPLFEESPLVSTDSNFRIEIVDLR